MQPLVSPIVDSATTGRSHVFDSDGPIMLFSHHPA